ncbi:hypothetical protein O4O00_03245 [Citrobacter sedlakii]|uniref:hypothetical protein n=1 Tax=Citrobacter sedlakii TaxID=67826 RepID=UPI0022B4708A|nr:hypothetical protein [Citrobacter sedlakii]MCZ4673401.1 hypothetical protein [Citrobacter sedlakii]MDR5003457.1 hypothetical protein [Citrobacter sedlakii]
MVVALNNKQDKNNLLTAIAGLNGGADALPYFTGASSAAQTTITQYARDLISQDYPGMRTLLNTPRVDSIAAVGLVSGNKSQSYVQATSDGSVVTIVPTTRTINNKPLSSYVVLNATDVGAPTGSSAQMCKAWCVFNGTTGTITAANNVSSVIKNGVGDFVVNFTSALASGNYAVIGSAYNNFGSSVAKARIFGAGIRTALAFNCYLYDNNTDDKVDSDRVELCIYGG